MCLSFYFNAKNFSFSYNEDDLFPRSISNTYKIISIPEANIYSSFKDNDFMKIINLRLSQKEYKILLGVFSNIEKPQNYVGK